MNRRQTRRPRRVRKTRKNPRRRRKQLINAPKNSSVVKGDSIKLVLQTSRNLLRIPRLRFMTDHVIVDLVYPDTSYTHNNVGVTYLSWRYRLNSIYDPDPALGSGSVPGYSAWSGFFNSYRVLATSYSLDISNLEASPVDVFVVPTTSDLGLNYPNANELFGQPYCSQALISAKNGMDRVRLKGYIDLGNFYGNAVQYLGNDAFGSGFGNNPGTILYLNVGGVSAANFTSGNGLDYRFTLTYTVLLTGRKTLVN